MRQLPYEQIKAVTVLFAFLGMLWGFPAAGSAQTPMADHGQGQACSDCHIVHNSAGKTLLRSDEGESKPGLCYTCHTSGVHGLAPDTQTEFESSLSHIPLKDDTECLACHELDEQHNDGRLQRWPQLKLKDPDPEDSHIYRGEKINDFCLSCHDNSPVELDGKKGVDLSSAYEFTGHGRIDINEPCTSCHEYHASRTKPFLLKDVIKNQAVTGNDNTVCYPCHSQADGSYGGRSAYESSEHGLRSKKCVDCHNPHGDNKDLCYLCHLEQYSSHYSNKRDKLCVDCHNPHQKSGLKMTKAEEEKLCYICHKEFEVQFGDRRKGISGSFSHHKVDDDEYGGGKVECFDCHNPHAVTKLNPLSDPGSSSGSAYPKPFGREAYNIRSDAYDDFCLSCHDGSRFSAADIKSELNAENHLETGFTSDGRNNLHYGHKVKGYGCQNCHDAHASSGTDGIKRGALLHDRIEVKSWDQAGQYNQGRSSCGGARLGLGCHQ